MACAQERRCESRTPVRTRAGFASVSGLERSAHAPRQLEKKAPALIGQHCSWGRNASPAGRYRMISSNARFAAWGK